MRKLSNLSLLIALFHVAISCKSTQPMSITAAQQTPKREVLKVLILGNSITDHGPVEALDWKGSWGMAASAKEKDFVHVLIDTLRKTTKKDVDFKYNNIAHWEQNFKNDFSNDSLVFYKPHILVIRLGENVEEPYARANDYYAGLVTMIDRFKGPHTHVIITGNFWPSAYKDEIQKKVAMDKGYAFVELADLDLDKKNQAIGIFKHPGVAIHPSDYGMFNIAMRIYARIIKEGWL